MLCFRHSRTVAKDNTVRYRRSTLQLLPGMERPTYAGVKVDVLEGLDGQLVVEHEGQLIPSQEAPSLSEHPARCEWIPFTRTAVS